MDLNFQEQSWYQIRKRASVVKRIFVCLNSNIIAIQFTKVRALIAELDRQRMRMGVFQLAFKSVLNNSISRLFV